MFNHCHGREQENVAGNLAFSGVVNYFVNGVTLLSVHLQEVDFFQIPY